MIGTARFAPPRDRIDPVAYRNARNLAARGFQELVERTHAAIVASGPTRRQLLKLLADEELRILAAFAHPLPPSFVRRAAPAVRRQQHDGQVFDPETPVDGLCDCLKHERQDAGSVSEIGGAG